MFWTSQRTAANVHTNAALQIEQQDGEDVPNLEHLERLEEPESLRSLREYVGAYLPPVDLPEVILEVAPHTGFFSQFTHVSDSNAHIEDLPLSKCGAPDRGMQYWFEAGHPARDFNSHS